MQNPHSFHHYFLFFFLIIIIQSSYNTTKSKKDMINIIKDNMDLTLCKSIFQLTRFFYESSRNIFRSSAELSESLTAKVSDDFFNDQNIICYGEGKFFTNHLKQNTNKILVKIKHHFEWMNEQESNSFSEKYESNIECPNNSSICSELRSMLSGNDLDLDIGRFNIGKEIQVHPDGSFKFILLKYNDLSSSQSSGYF